MIRDELCSKLSWVVGAGFVWVSTPEERLWVLVSGYLDKKAGGEDRSVKLHWANEGGSDSYQYHCSLLNIQALLQAAPRDLDTIETLLLEFVTLKLDNL
jgi:hypothetical protein